MSTLTYSIMGLPATYTVSQEYSEDWFLRFVLRVNGKFITSHPMRKCTEALARTHYNISKESPCQ